ncbi:CHAT domain-containing protein [Altibacter sp. HG106]|uniref:CHAT domain-containing protein n=1 Tax=Altibacter sp. HG106 TaxID=3023937 RepID=UPI00234FB978|nr:CHAT domain-containing protein [Altibacter sp. HG106]MDC7994208.1 CHAT domain-containing protein [Altibacter sp. HG106]
MRLPFGTYGLVFFAFYVSTLSVAQTNSVSEVSRIEELISNGQLQEARTAYHAQIERLQQQKAFDSLIPYIAIAGSLSLNNNDGTKALKNALALVQRIELQNQPMLTARAYKELAWIYSDAGQPRSSYEILDKARILLKEQPSDTTNLLPGVVYNMGYYASSLGNYPLSKKHYKDALKLLKASPRKDPVFYQQVYNALGGVMWFSGKMDSALYYFEASLLALKESPPDDVMNQFYRPGLINMNLAVIAQAMGNHSEAISYSQDAIDKFEVFMTRSKDEQSINQARGNLMAAIENLGSFYNAIGQFKRARDLVAYAYQEKQKYLEPTDPNLIISLVVLGQAESSLLNYEEAATYLDLALQRIQENPGIQLYWHASALTSRARIDEHEGSIETAKKRYLQAVDIYESTLQGEFTVDYITDLNVASLFFARNDEAETAILLAKRAYEFTRSGDFENTLQAFQQSVNMASVYIALKQYENALNYAEEALSMEVKRQDTTHKADSIALQFRKPTALLTKAKTIYHLEGREHPEIVTSILEELEEAFDILEQRKAFLKTYEDLQLLLEENNELFDFAKQLNIELYQQTQQTKYLHAIFSLQEASLYNRIRSRLNLRNDIAFSNVPTSILEQEVRLKQQLSNTFEAAMGMEAFFESNRNWNQFLDDLKTDHPKYYQMRYGSLEAALPSIQKGVPEGSTLVRYFFVEGNLYAMIFTKSNVALVELPHHNLDADIASLQYEIFDVAVIAPKLHALYEQLWKPISRHIETEDVIIIPDGILYNLNFEMLTATPIQSFKDMASESLLSKHTISYHFSPLLVATAPPTTSYDGPFIAFAPQFTKSMKEAYKNTVNDSARIDGAYFKLLPQPFSHALVKEFSRKWNGTSYLDDDAVKSAFTQYSKNHQIVHIGTHAESDNVNPELSRLIFAKALGTDEMEDNSLYTYELYNYDMSSSLTVLTACETGKPSYQPGEGMISLAHAFTYAGSESILTSLWKIDEQSSAIIIDHFYENLAREMPKHKALQQAKLQYLSEAKGRTLAPQYWAGLVLLGDTAPIPISSNTPWLWYFGVIGLLSILFYLFVRKK